MAWEVRGERGEGRGPPFPAAPVGWGRPSQTLSFMLRQVTRAILPGWMWSRIRVLRNRFAVARFRERIVEHRHGGFDIHIALTDPLACGWYDHDSDMREIDLLRRHGLRAGARVFNLGAHQGVVASVLARAVGPRGHVFAIEANPRDADLANRTKDLNGLDQLTVINAAATAESGTCFFHTLDGRLERSGNSRPGVVELPAVSIDDLADQHGQPDVLFVDIEGAEGEALRGAARTLATTPDCFVEVHVDWLGAWGDTVDTILNFFGKDRYDRFVASEGEPEFTRLENAAHLLGQRFFLVAIAKRG